MENKFKTGDIVILKSGGPKMTVKGPAWDANKGIYLPDKIVCNWFDELNKPHEAKFLADMIELAK
jgi:uncharacterized protein YodC (DUF2158 family)